MTDIVYAKSIQLLYTVYNYSRLRVKRTFGSREEEHLRILIVLASDKFPSSDASIIIES